MSGAAVQGYIPGSKTEKKKKKCQQFAFCQLQIKVISTQRVSPAGGEHPKCQGSWGKPLPGRPAKADTPEDKGVSGLQLGGCFLGSPLTKAPNQVALLSGAQRWETGMSSGP